MGGSEFSVICELVDLCTKRDPLANNVLCVWVITAPTIIPPHEVSIHSYEVGYYLRELMEHVAWSVMRWKFVG